MLNRLMFVYFIQRKGFLDGDRDYLRNRLNRCQQEKGKDKFYSFYRYFLLRLFHEGFGKRPKERAPDLEKLIGRIPYLNGGLFEQHDIEKFYGDNIQIPDGAFERIFNYFDEYHWHLDERPLRADNEINPDVLGYIFEKYINQKQMGAYYTKEDITEYISKNTVLPFLFDAARPKCKIAFENPNGPTLWNLLKANPDRYIYDPVKKGVDIPLPSEIQEGLDALKPELEARRKTWNKPAPSEFALPTEIWREVVARRKRCDEIRKKLTAGEIRDINELVTLNLDIRQFAQDVIENCEGPELLRAFWHAIEQVTILDPTCGSGAFLFAALNVLEPLYEACLDRMEAFVADLERAGEKHRPEKFADFRAVLEQVAAHPNRRYFIFKSIILNNLFGVDIMEEAVEICKLRLFLKLAAQVEPDAGKDNLGIEPLPDIDFNIRAGNTLIGYATADEVKRCLKEFGGGQMRLGVEDELNSYSRFAERVDMADRAFHQFRQMQTERGMDARDFLTAKQNLRERLKLLKDELNRYLAGDYGVKLSDKAAFERWAKTHQPFHWFVEFYGIVSNGGFDVIIGNPPWVEFAKVQKDYAPKGLATLECNNLWAFVVERSYDLLGKNGRIGLIVPMSLVCTERMLPIQKIVRDAGVSWLSNFESDSNPGQLFDGVKQNVTILVGCRNRESRIWTTRLFRFFQEYRDFVFYSVEFTQPSKNPMPFGFPKVSTEQEVRLLSKLFCKPVLAMQMNQAAPAPVLVHRIAHYYIKCFNFVPYFRSDRDGVKKSEDYKEYYLNWPNEQFVACINSTTFYFYWQVFFDAFKAGKLCVESFPFGNAKDTGTHAELTKAAKFLMHDIKAKSTRLKAKYAATGTVEYDQFYPRNSKSLIDEIDRVLARHYGFTPEELDFIINYDIKYRLGRDAEDSAEEELL
ncbi:MAG TPA: DNA methyltransferase [Verrucomicrobiae bacterium]|nr:DNA methyltransferase [Verrucomicrobiae bacterium]